MKSTRRNFTLTKTIQTRRALRFANRFGLLNFGKRMQLAKAEQAITAAFNLA